MDFVLLNNLHSATQNLKATMNQERDARDLVTLAVAGSSWIAIGIVHHINTLNSPEEK